MQQCDLLEVYSDTDKQRLKETIDQTWHVLESNDVTKIVNGSSNDDVVFTTNDDAERDLIIQEMRSQTSEKITLRLGEIKGKEEEEEQEINFDDI